jgi:hypothetical protein
VKIVKLAVLGLAAYGAKTLYDQYGAKAKQVAGRRDELTGQVRKVADTARGSATQVVGHASEAAKGVVVHAKRSATEVAGESREAASTVASEAREAASAVADEVREAAATADTPGTATSDASTAPDDGNPPEVDLTSPATAGSGAVGSTAAGGRARTR